MTVARGPKQGTTYRAEVPTSYVGTMAFHSGMLATLLMSFDIRGTTMPPLEIYGEAGTLRLPFPGFYNGAVIFGTEHDHVTERIEPGWRTAVHDARGIGVEELAASILTDTPSRLEGAFPLHVLECMDAIVEAARSGQAVGLTTTTPHPAVYVPDENPRNVILG